MRRYSLIYGDKNTIFRNASVHPDDDGKGCGYIENQVACIQVDKGAAPVRT